MVSTSSETYCLLLKPGWFRNDDFHVQTDYWSVRIVPVCMFFICASCSAQEFLCTCVMMSVIYFFPSSLLVHNCVIVTFRIAVMSRRSTSVSRHVRSAYKAYFFSQGQYFFYIKSANLLISQTNRRLISVRLSQLRTCAHMRFANLCCYV